MLGGLTKPAVVLGHVLRESLRVLHTAPSDLVVVLLVLEVDTLHILRHSKGDRETFAAEILRQLVHDFQYKVELAILLICCEGWEYFDGQHAEVAFHFILQRDALAERW